VRAGRANNGGATGLCAPTAIAIPIAPLQHRAIPIARLQVPTGFRGTHISSKGLCSESRPTTLRPGSRFILFGASHFFSLVLTH
jgi:hypothetical protein